jgi:uncharacterized protein (TIGR04222 family)
MMDPFTLPGPKFLVFYALFACVVVLTLYLARRHSESGPLPNLDIKDPYLFACLNGGVAEVIRIAVLGLVDRGVLQVSGGTLETAAGVSIRTGWSGIEKEILGYFTRPATLDAALKEARMLDFVSTNYETRLRSHRLVPDASDKRARHMLVAAAILALAAVGGAKLWTAWSQGRSNVGVLIVMMIVAAIAAISIANPYRTSLGDAYLKSLRSLFSRLRDRAATIQPGGGSRDLLWLTAVFGAGALPLTTFPFVRDLFPKRSSSSDGGASCGSGGGGGCGGGGGGCGGCGS